MDWKDYTNQRDWKDFWTDGERSELLKDALAFEKLVVKRGGVVLHGEKIPFIKAGLLGENIYGEPNTPLFGEEINCPSLRRLSFESEAQYLERIKANELMKKRYVEKVELGIQRYMNAIKVQTNSLVGDTDAKH